VCTSCVSCSKLSHGAGCCCLCSIRAAASSSVGSRSRATSGDGRSAQPSPWESPSSELRKRGSASARASGESKPRFGALGEVHVAEQRAGGGRALHGNPRWCRHLPAAAAFRGWRRLHGKQSAVAVRPFRLGKNAGAPLAQPAAASACGRQHTIGACPCSTASRECREQSGCAAEAGEVGQGLSRPHGVRLPLVRRWYSSSLARTPSAPPPVRTAQPTLLLPAAHSKR
jgi:hypothetical protein